MNKQKKIQGSLNKPRLYIFKSNKHLYAQIIDDYNRRIITSSSTISNKFANCQSAAFVGKNIADKLRSKGITEIVFDRGKNVYHGKIKSLAEATRKQGINF
uniref:Large ribosomal subunit protein uL18c n=1 Tax=Halydictyon mirabile TaxID=189652 RepID=A0A4D6WTH2_9FLOR|nr:ribosomal protein L18 [Halydictyon mirabile]